MAPPKRPAPQDGPNAVSVDTARPPFKRHRHGESDLETTRRHLETARIVLEKTVAGRYRNGISNYDHVGVLLVCWEQEDHRLLGQEIHRLEAIFKSQYNFEVEVYLIPSEQTVTSLNLKVAEFARRYDRPSDLAIFYYGGHGAGEDNRLKLYAQETPNGTGHPSAFFDNVVYSLHHCDTDVLIITDCCYAALAFTEKEVGKRKFELLTATGPQNTAYAAKSPQSFTKHLCETLQELVDTENGFTTSRLYRKLYFKADPEFKPFLFDQSIQDWGRITICPLEYPRSSVDAMETDGPASPKKIKGVTVLSMELKLRSKPKPHNMNELARAMQYLPYVKEIKFEKLYAPKAELKGFMDGVTQAMKIRPLVIKLRERIQRKRELEGRGPKPHAIDHEPENSPTSPTKSPSHIYNWDKSELIEPHNNSPDAVDTPQHTMSFPSAAKLVVQDQEENRCNIGNASENLHEEPL